MNAEEYVVMRQQEDTHWWYRALRGAVVRTLQSQMGSAPRLLDAGCGTGGMMAAVRTAFPRAELTGLDFDEQAVRLSAERGVADHLLRGSANALPFKTARFDAALSLDVLYHQGIDDGAAFAELKRVLRPGGVLIINLPAFESLRGAHDVAVHTARRYEPHHLRQLAAAQKLEVEHWTCWNTALSPLVWLWRRRGRLAGSGDSDLRSLPPLLNTVLEGLLRLEWTVAERLSLPFGSSLFAILRKTAA
jgi:SAM-dependent methyltransferase